MAAGWAAHRAVEPTMSVNRKTDSATGRIYRRPSWPEAPRRLSGAAVDRPGVPWRRAASVLATLRAMTDEAGPSELETLLTSMLDGPLLVVTTWNGRERA